MDDDKFSAPGTLKQYAHLTGMHLAMPVIRKLLGLSEYGKIPTDTALGRALQRFAENDSKDAVCESGVNQYTTSEPGRQGRYDTRPNSGRIIDSTCEDLDSQ